MRVIAGSYKDNIGQALAAWYTQESGINFHTVYTATGFVDDEGQIKLVNIYTDFNGCNIELHLVGRCLITRQHIRSVYLYVFEQLNCERLTVKLLRRDKALAKILVRLGFKYECTLKYYYGLSDSQDALVFRCLRADVKDWIK